MGKKIKMDLKGELCPFPLMMATEKLIEAKPDLDSGEAVIELLIDHPPACKSIPSEAKKRGYNTKMEKIGRGEWRITIGSKEE